MAKSIESEDALSMLELLRKTIRAAAPRATVTISYAIPTFKYLGRLLVYFAAWKDHCSFYPASTAVMVAHTDELKPYDIDK